MSTFQWSLF